MYKLRGHSRTLAQTSEPFPILARVYTGFGLPATLLAALLCACGGSFEPYETESGSATRLDGTKVAVHALTVSEARRLRPRKPVSVRGYLLAPRDDRSAYARG